MALNTAKFKGIDDALTANLPIEVISDSDSIDFAREALDSAQNKEKKKEAWPTLDKESAFYGVSGRIVEKVSPETEADPVALLIQLLGAFGNMAGRSNHFLIGSKKHFPNIFSVLVGDTSVGRKGTSWSHVEDLLRKVDDNWVRTNTNSGLSSGEGLIWAIRDPITKSVYDKASGETKEVVEDHGVEDKRLFVLEAEFASALKAISRDGNTLSAIIRKSWDGDDLKTMVKNSKACATDPHVSIASHITKEELKKYFTETESANGFGNRFLWICVRRSKFLPDGGNCEGIDFSKEVSELRAALDFAKSERRIAESQAARTIWHEVYPKLTKDRHGLLGAMLGRGAPLVRRLSVIYALLDCSAEIKPKHIQAALAIWEYNEQCVHYLFKGTLGDSVADEILKALRATKEGLTRTEIRDLFRRSQSLGRINVALEYLLEGNLAYSTTEPPSPKGGRPVERWFYKKFGR